MSSDYILTLEAIDRRLYAKDRTRPLVRYSSSGMDPPAGNHTPAGLSEDCLTYMNELLTRHDRPNVRIDTFFFLHFGGWDALMDYIRADNKRRHFLLRCEEKGYSVASDRALFDRMLVCADPGEGLSLPSDSMKCILEANILIVSRYCGIYTGKTKKDLRDEIEGFLRNSPGEEKNLVPQMELSDRYAIFRQIRSLLDSFDILTGEDRGEEADRALGTALAWLVLAALLRDSCRCLCSLLPRNIQVLRIEEKEAARGDLPAVAPVSLPPRSGRIFKGRQKELDWIEDRLRQDRSPVWITGDGGSGKTSLALRFASLRPDSCCVYAPFHDDLVQTVCDIRFQDRLICEELPPEELFSFTLSRITRFGGRLLLIIDNFDAEHYDRTFFEMLGAVCDSDPEERTNADILDLLCRTGADLLLTTRLRVPPQYPSICLSDSDHLLSRAELTELAKEICDDHLWTEEEEVMMEEIILFAGKHVMVVELIAAALRYSAGFSTVEEILEKVRGGKYALIQGESGPGPAAMSLRKNPGGTVGFSTSPDLYSRLSSLFSFSAFTQEQQALLRVLSLLPSAGLDRALFLELCDGSFSAETLRAMLLRFRDLHLIRAGSTISMHPVTADLAQDALAPDLQNCGSFFLRALGYYEPYADQTCDYRLLTQISRLLMRGFDRLDFSRAADPAADPSSGPAPDLRLRTALRISLIEFVTGHPQTALRWAQTSLQLTEENSSEETSSKETSSGITAEVCKACAQAESALGQYEEAFEHYRRAAALQESMENPDLPGIAVTYNDLSMVCYETGDFDRAEEYLQTALKIQTDTYGPDSFELSTTCSNLGLLCSAREKSEQAVLWYKKSLSLQLGAYGELHPDTAVICCNLGQEYNDMGMYEEAEAFLTRALRINTELFGENFAGSAGICNNLGLLYDNRSRAAAADLSAENSGEEAAALLDTAFHWFWQALSILEQNYGLLHPRTADLYINMADAFLTYNDRVSGLRCFETAVSILEQVLGPDHPRTQAVREDFLAIKRATGSGSE